MKISHDGSCKFFREDLVCVILFGYLVYGGGGGGAGGPASTFFISIEKKKNESRIFRVFFYFYRYCNKYKDK